MKLMLPVAAVFFFFVVFAHADETVGDFSFKTAAGKTIGYKAANRSPLVVNIGAYW